MAADDQSASIAGEGAVGGDDLLAGVRLRSNPVGIEVAVRRLGVTAMAGGSAVTAGGREDGMAALQPLCGQLNLLLADMKGAV